LVETKQKKATYTFSKEATDRLQKAINSNDLVNVQVAVGMLDGAKK
jgi:endonuclease YncB( thermonuclease family)